MTESNQSANLTYLRTNNYKLADACGAPIPQKLSTLHSSTFVEEAFHIKTCSWQLREVLFLQFQEILYPKIGEKKIVSRK